MPKVLFASPIASICLLASVATAEPVVIDFEGLERGEMVDDQFIRQGVKISAVNWSHGPDVAAVFDTTDIGASSDEDLEAPIDPTAGFESEGDLWPGNVLVLHERHDCANGICAEPDDEGGRPAGWLEFQFSGPVTLHDLKLIDILYESDEPAAQFVLYGADGAVIASLDVPNVGQADWRPWEIGIGGVQRAKLYLPGDGAIDDIRFSHDNDIVNWTPRFESNPPIVVSPGDVYRYQPVVRDIDGDATTFALTQAPAGMVIGADGEIVWAPGGETGAHPVTVQADDGRGGVASQSFTVHSAERFVREQGFEFPTGTIVDDELLGDGLLISARNLSSGSDYAVAFNTEAPTGGDDDLAAPFEGDSATGLDFGMASPGKVLVLHEEHDCDVLDLMCEAPDDETTRPAGWIEFRFSQPAHVASIDVFDITSDDPTARTVELFDTAGQPLNAGLVVPRPGSRDWDRLVIDATGVSRMRLNLDGDGAFDNLRYALLGDPDDGAQGVTAADDTYVVTSGNTLEVIEPGILANDSGPDGVTLAAELVTNPENGALSLDPEGSFSYSPAEGFEGTDTFTYRAVAGGEASSPATVTIQVEQADPFVNIGRFDVTPARIAPGESAMLAWSVDNAITVVIQPGFSDLPTAGSRVVQPSETTTYTLTATGADGNSVSATTTLEVVEPPPPPSIDTFTVTPSNISAGQEAILSWSVSGASAVVFQPGAVPVANAGSLVVSPAETTTYQLVATNTVGDSASRSVVLHVAQEVIIDIDIPAEGAFAKGPLPYFHISVVSDGGTVIDTSTLQTFRNGEPLDANCSYTYTQHFGCRPVDPFPEGPVTIAASVANHNGETSNLATRNFVVDSTAPLAPDTAKISVSPSGANMQVIVAGAPGGAEPGATVRIDTGSTIHLAAVDAQGAFTKTITASAGRLLTIDVMDAAGNISPDVEMTVPAPPPEIVILSPSPDTFLSDSTPEIGIEYPATGTGIDFDSLEISVNDEAVVTTCAHQPAASRCELINPLPQGQVTVTATIADTAGTRSAPASTTFHVDTLPPAAVDRDKVILVQEPEGIVTVTGEAGAAEPGATVVVEFGAMGMTVPADAEGAFELVVIAGTGDVLTLFVQDAAGNHGETKTFIVQPMPIQVQILEPYDGQQLTGNRVTVRGSHSGEYGTGVTVNGDTAAVATDGSFFAEIELGEGLNEIVAIATPLSGDVVTHDISVTIVDGPSSPISIKAYEPQGVAPHGTRFELSYDGDLEAIEAIEIDYDGDGEAEHLTINPFDELSYEFDQAGVYHPVVTLHSNIGTFTESTTVVVDDVGNLDTFLRARFNEFTQGLQSGDKLRALAILSPGARKRFEPLFDTILPVIQENLSSWESPQLIQISGGMAEYLVLRRHEGNQHGYPVTFQRMPDGTWKLTNL